MNLAETRTHSPILNKPKEKKGRKPIPKVTPKRAKANRLYSKLRKEYLSNHPYCQVTLSILEIKEDECIELGGRCTSPKGTISVIIPAATEIHHTKKPKCKYLNDTATWLAVCKEMHDKIENNKSWAREMGYLQDN